MATQTKLIFLLWSLSLIIIQKGNGEVSLDYPVDPIDVITYIELGKPCNPDNNDSKEGICRATLYCERSTNLCDCEDTGPYLYTEDGGECKNYVGSQCLQSENCVGGAQCNSNSTCICDPGQTCKDKKVPVQSL